MHPTVFSAFEEICSARDVRGRVLEVGATPTDDSLLNLKSLAGVAEKIGINIDGPHCFRDFKIVRGNANRMDVFPDAHFDAVLSNSVLEHDRYFWKTLQEIRRVAKAGALVVIGAPGFVRAGLGPPFSYMARIPLAGRWFRPLESASLTLPVHDFPSDYYRFSERAFREVILEGLNEAEVRCVMTPPRMLGWGRVP